MNDLSTWLLVATAVGSMVAAFYSATATRSAPHSAAKLAEELRRAQGTVDIKRDCLRRVVGLRSSNPRPDWLAAMNEIVVTFNDAPEVIRSMTNFERNIRRSGSHDNADLVDLIKSMMDDLGLDRSKFDDEFLLRPLSSRT